MPLQVLLHVIQTTLLLLYPTCQFKKQQKKKRQLASPLVRTEARG